MPAEISKTRQHLRDRFVRGTIPTEADFSDLIGAGLNQADDGVIKPKQPLHVNGAAAVTALHAEEVWIGGKKLSPDNPLDGRLTILANGNLGIGETQPAARLTVRQDANVDQITADPASSLRYGGHLAIKSTSPQLDFIDLDAADADWAIHVNQGRMSFVASPWTLGLILWPDGKVGVNTTAPKANLHVNGDLLCNELIINNKYRFDDRQGEKWLRLYEVGRSDFGTLGFAASKFWTYSGGYTSSDRRAKVPESIASLCGVIDQIRRLNPVRFRYKQQPSTALPKLGFIAQELETILPEAVATGPDGMKGIQDSCLIALLAQALKEQQAQIDALQHQLAGAP